MARWREREPPRLEAPGWYRAFDLAAWDEPDARELAMTGGCPSGMMPELHDWHARRRWHAARHAYRQGNPAFAEQELTELLERARAEHNDYLR